VDRLRVAGLIGSLRRDSLNRKLFRFAADHAPSDLDLFEVPISDLPLYNEDLTPPPIVQAFWRDLEIADAVLFVTPEYNYSIPAPLKNAIDWASRDPRALALHGKPAAIMGASQGPFGTVRAQMHLRNTLVFLDMEVVGRPEVLLTQAQSHFAPDGDLKNEIARALVTELLSRLSNRTRQNLGTRTRV
jgi:chromate reductase